MRSVLMCLLFVPVAFGTDSGKSIDWKPTPQRVEVPQRRLDIVLSTPLPEHWALTVVASGKVNKAANISAASVVLDGALIESLNNLDLSRLDVRTGAVRIQGVPNEPGLAICVTVPEGTEVKVFRDDLLIRTASAGMFLQDGRATAGTPRSCGSVPLLQQAILGR